MLTSKRPNGGDFQKRNSFKHFLCKAHTEKSRQKKIEKENRPEQKHSQKKYIAKKPTRKKYQRGTKFTKDGNSQTYIQKYTAELTNQK